jgi:hypothetical protein
MTYFKVCGLKDLTKALRLSFNPRRKHPKKLISEKSQFSMSNLERRPQTIL